MSHRGLVSDLLTRYKAVLLALDESKISRSDYDYRHNTKGELGADTTEIVQPIMQQLQSGQHFGANKNTLNFDGCIITEAGYSAPMIVPWHYHENAYFYYHIKGHLLEVNRKQSFTCIPGTVLFHHWQDPHYDRDFSEDVHFLHIELQQKWFQNHHCKLSGLEGSIHINNPLVKLLFVNIIREIKINDNATSLSLEGLMMQVFAHMMRSVKKTKSSLPEWTKKIKEILQERCTEKTTLTSIADQIGIHPVHLSQEFPKYFHTSFGNYIRKLKIDRAIPLLADKNLTLTKIAYDCGFADQSHFIRCFKDNTGLSPSVFRRRILRP